MKTIVYGKSVNPVKKINAATRRHARRKAEAIQRELVASRIDKVLGLKPEKRQSLSKWEKLSKRKPAPPVDLSTLTQYQEQITLSAQKHMQARYPHRGAFVEFEEGSCCLENVALFQAGYRKCENVIAKKLNYGYTDFMSYSIDFRRRILSIKKHEGLSIRETAKRFHIGTTTIVR